LKKSLIFFIFFQYFLLTNQNPSISPQKCGLSLKFAVPAKAGLRKILKKFACFLLESLIILGIWRLAGDSVSSRSRDSSLRNKIFGPKGSNENGLRILGLITI